MERSGKGARPRRRAGRIRGSSLLLLLLLGAGGLWAWTFGPYYWDFMKLKEINRLVAREWSALGEAKARAMLDSELGKSAMADYVYPQDCQFTKVSPNLMRLHCAYSVDVQYPFVERYRTLSFEVTTDVDNRGQVDQY